MMMMMMMIMVDTVAPPTVRHCKDHHGFGLTRGLFSIIMVQNRTYHKLVNKFLDYFTTPERS